MAFYLENRIMVFRGASTDTKPTSGIPMGSRFYEKDTKLMYVWYGDNWYISKIEHGLIFAGTCDAGMTGSTTDLYCADLAGYGNDYFNNKFYMQIIKNTNSIGGAPDNEIRLITDYVSATGKFVCDAFTANAEETDEIFVIHEFIYDIVNIQKEVAAFVPADYDNYDIADADADNERWTPAYITGAEGGSADINTSTAGKLMVKVDPDATPTEARYGVKKSLSLQADYFMIITDLNLAWGATDSATPKAAGIIISKSTSYDANNFISIERQKGTGINRIQARATLNSVSQAAANFTTTKLTVALKIERWDNVWRIFYSLTQYPNYVWVALTQYEDPSNFMTGEVCFYNEVYSVGSADAESVQCDFDNFQYYIGAGGGGQYIAGDYDSTHITNDVDGNVFERQEALQRAIQVVAGGGIGFEADASGATAYNIAVAKYGEADAGGDADTLVDAALTEANDFYNGHYLAFISGNNAGLARPIVDQVLGSTSLEVRPAFPNAIVATDKYVILTRHEIQVPAQNGTENYMPRDVIGNKTDAAPAMNAVPADTDSIVKHLKALRETVGQEPADADDSLHTITGQRDDAAPAMNAAPIDTDTVIKHLKAIRETVGQEPADSDSSLHTIMGQPDDAIPGMNAAPGDDSVVKHLKAILERVGATPADPDDSLMTTVGQRDDAATNDDMSDIASTSIVAKLRLILNRLSTDAFTATIQGSARTALDTMIAQLATYIAANGAALSIQVNNNTARTNLEQVIEDVLAVIGCDNANVFNPSIGGAERTSFEAAFAALGTALGAEFDGTPDVYDVLVTGHDSSAIGVNEDGSIEERSEGIKATVGENALLTTPTKPTWDDVNKWFEGNALQILQKIVSYLGKGDAAGNAEITEDTSVPGRLAQDTDSVINRIGNLTGRSNDANIIAALGLDNLPDAASGDLYTLLWKFLINTAIATPTTKTGLQYLQAIGSNDNNNDFDSTNVAANAVGSVLERLQNIVATYLADGTIGLAAIETLVDGIESELANATYGLSALETLVDDLETELAKVPKSDAAVTFNATALQSIQDEAEDALEGENLDHLAATACSDTTDPADMSPEVADHSIIANILTDDGDISNYDRRTMSLEAISSKIGNGVLQIEADAGTTSSVIIDAAALTQATANWWKHALLISINGQNSGQARPVVSFSVAGDSVKVYPAFLNTPDAGDDFLLVSSWRTQVWDEQPAVAVNITAILASPTNIFDLSTTGYSYKINSLRINAADPGANTIYVRLYELINGSPVLTDTFNITTANYTQYFSLMDMFGVTNLVGDDLMITVQCSADGPYIVTGQYHFSLAPTGTP